MTIKFENKHIIYQYTLLNHSKMYKMIFLSFKYGCEIKTRGYAMERNV